MTETNERAVMGFPMSLRLQLEELAYLRALLKRQMEIIDRLTEELAESERRAEEKALRDATAADSEITRTVGPGWRWCGTVGFPYA